MADAPPWTPPAAMIERCARDYDPEWWTWFDGLLPSTRESRGMTAARDERLARCSRWLTILEAHAFLAAMKE